MTSPVPCAEPHKHFYPLSNRRWVSHPGTFGRVILTETETMRGTKYLPFHCFVGIYASSVMSLCTSFPYTSQPGEYRRMTAWINRLNGPCCSKNRIHRIMQTIGIHSVIRKQRKKYKKATPERTAENILKRDFNASRPNEKWVTDVTEFKWYEGAICHKLYLSAILDLYARSVVSFVLSRRNDNRSVFQTFGKAIASNPDAKPIFHSDRGFQYTSSYFRSTMQKQGMAQSMSCVAHCIDNGPTEGFWGT